MQADATVVDALAIREGNHAHDLGIENAPHLLLRQVTCTHGEVQIEVEYIPRSEYGVSVEQMLAAGPGPDAAGSAPNARSGCRHAVFLAWTVR